MSKITNSDTFQIVDSMQVNMHFEDGLNVLNEHINRAIDQNDPGFLQNYYDYCMYAALPGYVEHLNEVLTACISNSIRPEFRDKALLLYILLQHGLGNSDLVREYSQRLLESSPENFNSLYYLVRNGGEISEIGRYKSLWRKRSKRRDCASLGFSLYEYKERKGDGTAQQQLNEANRYTDDIIRKIPKPKFQPIITDEAIIKNTDGSSIAPVFIVGLPRSGSSLIEKQLSGFGGVRALGESNFLKISGAYAGTDMFFKGEIPDGEASLKILKYYVQQIISRGYEEKYFIDKSLINLNQVDNILRIFPNARIVVAQRDPIKNSVSIYRKYFQGHYSYAYNLDRLTSYVARAHRLIEQYKTRYENEDRVHFVTLEEHVQNHANIEKLVESVFGTDDVVNQPVVNKEDNELVKTASTLQIRRPMSPEQIHSNDLLSGIEKSIGKLLTENLYSG